MKALAVLLLLTIELIAQPIDSIHYEGRVNGLACDGLRLLAATDGGIIDLQTWQIVTVEPTNAMSIYHDFLWSVSVAGTLRQMDMNGEEYFHCQLMEPDSAPEVQVSLCYPEVLFNYGSHNLSGLWRLEDCSKSQQHPIYPIGAARLRGLIFDRGHYWVGEWQTCEIHRLSIHGNWAMVDSTIDFSDYGERLLGFCGEVGDLWIALQKGNGTMIYHFCKTSDVKFTKPVEELELNIYPNPAGSFAEIIEPHEFIVYNLLGREVFPPLAEVPAGIYFLVEKGIDRPPCIGKLMITK